MQEKHDNPYIDNVFSNFGGALGGLAVGAVAGSAFGPVGTVAGTVVGATGGLLIGRLAPFPKNIAERLRQYFVVQSLLAQKLTNDFRQCFLLDTLAFEAERRSLRERLNYANVVSHIENDERVPHEEEWKFFDRLVDDNSLETDLRLLAQRGRIRVNASCVNPGAIAVITSLMARFGESHGLNIEVDTADNNGREQMITVGNREDYDFIVAPFEAFFLSDTHSSRHYRLLGPVSGETQFAFRKKSSISHRRSLVWSLSDSSAEFHYRLGVGLPRNSEQEPLRDSQVIATLPGDIAGGDIVIAWDPLSYMLQQNTQFDVIPGSRYTVTYCLFCHRSWRHPTRHRLRNAFKRCFQNEWRYCQTNQRKVLKSLRKNHSFMEHFASGSGFAWTPELEV